MPRSLHVAAAQIGPILRSETREAVVRRLIKLMEESANRGAELVVYPECALSTFFPRLVLSDEELLEYFDESMPNSSVQPLFDAAKKLGVAFHLGYAELDQGTRYNSSILVGKDGSIIGKYRKTHLPGTSEPIPHQKTQHLEKKYFTPGNTGFKVWDALGGKVGMLVCNDRRWPEAWRCLGLQGVELVLLGWNTPITHYRKDLSYSRLTEFHNKLSLQAGCYQNGTWCVGVAHTGQEESDYILMGQSMIVSPLGEVVAMANTLEDEVVDYVIDLDKCRIIKDGVFDFDRYRRPEMYQLIVDRKGVNG